MEQVVGWWAIEEYLIWTRELEIAEAIMGAFVSIKEVLESPNS